MLAALAFLPPIDVPRGFDTITELELRYPTNESTIPLDYLIYFENTWVGRRVGLGSRLPPDYPIALWNCRTAALDLAPRTTNALEGWHNGLRSCIDGNHPTIWRFLNVSN